MLNHAYANSSGYFWLIAVAVFTYLAMMIIKRPLARITKQIAANEKERRFLNILFGIGFCLLVSFVTGKAGNYLFGANIHFMWFFGGGLLAHYANLLYKRCKEADYSAFAKSFVSAMNESNMDVSEEDLPVLTNEISAIVKAYADSNLNSHTSKIRGVASGIAGSVEITEDEQKELVKAIERIKSSGVDTAKLDEVYARIKADGKITAAEAADLKKVIRDIHNVTNI